MKKFYCYVRCSTCKKAEKWLLENQVQFDKQDLVADPPTKEELLAIFAKSDRPLRYFFNTSGQDYRKLNLKEKVPTMTKDEAAKMMSENGKLIKRPLMFDENTVTCGFKPEVYQKTWL